MFSFWKKNKTENVSASIADVLKIKDQLESQVRVLQKIGVLVPVLDPKTGLETLGILGVDNQKYPVPAIEDIIKRINDNEDLLRTKVKQGFTKMLLVPLAYPLNKLIEKYEESIRWHYANNKLFYTKGKEEDARLNLNKENPLNVWNEYENADINNYLVYFPKIFKKENHQGKTKKELLTNPDNAWLILLVEDIINIPKDKKGKTLNDRSELESGKSPDDYLRVIQTEPSYEGEIGLPPEASIIHDITRLEETDHVINDWLSGGSIEYNIGAFFATTENIPWSSWNSDFNRADLWKANSWNKDEFMGTRTAVRV